MSESLKKKVYQFYNKWRRELDELCFRSKIDRKNEKKKYNKRDKKRSFS